MEDRRVLRSSCAKSWLWHVPSVTVTSELRLGSGSISPTRSTVIRSLICPCILYYASVRQRDKDDGHLPSCHKRTMMAESRTYGRKSAIFGDISGIERSLESSIIHTVELRFILHSSKACHPGKPITAAVHGRSRAGCLSSISTAAKCPLL